MRKQSWIGSCLILWLLLAACAAPAAEEARLANDAATVEVYRSPT